ncbi:5763_t:CDS:2 [Funneliformis caledonium]|uniref:5763_t:CDS:1 n=1 Tax=Funneliformis caledonium TaxID=1117310 RepID=A0A9N9E3P4_9GLOM|nr:5763_t:CDS:2 [Funneliformis caledonium]
MNQLITTTGSTWKHPIAGTIQPSMYNSWPSAYYKRNHSQWITEIQHIARYG